MNLSTIRNNGRSVAVNSVFFACTAFLAAEPAWWLVRTWFDASWGSYGEYAFVAVVLLFGWSVTSPRRGRARVGVPAFLFAVTAVVRVIGHLLAVNVIGALALVVDVYALGLLFGTGRRSRAVSPFWLAMLFGLALPLERIIQRVIGFGLQQVSAAGACGALTVGFEDVRCRGADIVLHGQHVLVDLPCSGARGLLLMAAAFVGLAALVRPGLGLAVGGIAVALMSALVSNTMRIVALAIGIGFPELVGVDVMAQPWHDAIGLVALGLGLTPVVVWARAAMRPVSTMKTREEPTERTRGGRPVGVVAGVLVAACAAVALTPHRPVDVARRVEALDTPTRVGGWPARRVELSDREQEYFTRFGGSAAKARYGARSVLLVRTSAPLRHLHAPDECLVGAGFEVERLGISHGVMPGAGYRAVAPDGSVWRVIVTYRSDRGETATSVSEAVWLWLQNPRTTWTAIERAHPWGAPIRQNERFDGALARRMDDSTH